MLDSLEIETLLLAGGFSLVENKTHVVGYDHAALGEQRVYLKDGRDNLAAKRKAVRKQPLVVHPQIQRLPGFEGTRVSGLAPNRKYMNGNMSKFPSRNGASATGIAVDIPDAAALDELLRLMGVRHAVAMPTSAPLAAPVVASSAARALPAPAAGSRKPKSGTYTAGTLIEFAEHCCQGKGRLAAGSFTLDDLAMATEGSRRLRFAPLGNKPTAPRLALVGITPGGQIERFAESLASMSVEAAASHAAFHGSQKDIKQLLAAHGFAGKLKISLEGDLNQNPEILTTSVVKCCLMVDDGYRFAAPDIASSPAALRCATERLADELRAYPTLRWVVVFGKPAWDALHELRLNGCRVIDALRDAGLRVLRFPHFAQNFQQRAVFACDGEAEAELLARKPHYAKNAPAARQMRAEVVAALATA